MQKTGVDMKKFFFLGCVASLLLVAGCGDDDKDKDGNNSKACTPACANNKATTCDAKGNAVELDCGTKGCNAAGTACNTASSTCTKDVCQGNFVIKCNSGVPAAPVACTGCTIQGTTAVCKEACKSNKCENNTLYTCTGGSYSTGTACPSGACAADGIKCADCVGNNDVCKDGKVYACNNGVLGSVKEECTKGCNTDNKTCKPECTADVCDYDNDGKAGMYKCTNGKLAKTPDSTWCENGCSLDFKSCEPKCTKTECRYDESYEFNATFVCDTSTGKIVNFIQCPSECSASKDACTCETDSCLRSVSGDSALFKCNNKKLETTKTDCTNGCLDETQCRPTCSGDVCDIDGSLLKCDAGKQTRESCPLGCDNGACIKCTADVCKSNKLYACNNGVISDKEKQTCSKGCNEAGTACIPETITENYCVGDTLIKASGNPEYCKAGCDPAAKACKDESNVDTNRIDLNLFPVPANQINYEGATCAKNTFVEFCADAHTGVWCNDGKVARFRCYAEDSYGNIEEELCITDLYENANYADCYDLCEQSNLNQTTTECGVSNYDFEDDYPDYGEYLTTYKCVSSAFGYGKYWESEVECSEPCDDKGISCVTGKTCSGNNYYCGTNDGGTYIYACEDGKQIVGNCTVDGSVCFEDEEEGAYCDWDL